MNKQELIEKIEAMPNDTGFIRPKIDKHLVLGLVRQLDEQKPVKIPHFVAEHIEWTKEEDFHLLGSMSEIRSHKNKKIDEWFEKDDNMEIFARAWLDGYEVEKEPKYTVKIKTVLGQYLGRYYLNNEELTPQFIRTQVTGKEKLPTFTQKELEEADFGWVFDCPGIEIEEATE